MRTGGLSHIAHRRLHAAIGIDTEVAYRAALVTWATGLPVLYPEPGFHWAEFIHRSQPQVLVLVPAQLAAILSVLPVEFPLQKAMSLIVVSGSLSTALLEKTKAKLTPNVYVTYGSTEVGLVTLASPGLLGLEDGLTGVVIPAAKVQVVDGAGDPVSWGSPGHVRLRTDEMVSEYLDDAESTRRCFRDGWFYPGDIGAISATGKLTLYGRETEIMELGGARIAPKVIEDVILGCVGVQDAAAYSLAIGDDGVHKPYAAVVCEPTCDFEQVHAELRRALPQLSIELVCIDAIPRSRRGKVDRNALPRLRTAD